MNYDSTEETLKHIHMVRSLLDSMIWDLNHRAIEHDNSKFQEPEKSGFDEYTPKLRAMIYGSDEYKATLAEMKPFLDHHYEHNDHHPEHFGQGVDGMNLLQIIEMLADWKASTQRLADGDMQNSIKINTKRFNLSPQLVKILENTISYLEW